MPEVDWKDGESWKNTPASKTVTDELMGIADTADAHGGPTADETGVLINYMNSSHYSVRESAAIVAESARSDPARSVLMPHVIGLLYDPVPTVRLWAANSLGEMGDKNAIPYLEPLLKDRPAVVRVVQAAISKLQNQKETVPKK